MCRAAMDPAIAWELEAASLRAWAALESEQLDGWELRCSGGFTKRANSVQPLGSSSRPLSEKVRECEAWYADRGLPTVFRLTPFAERGLEPILERRGYQLLDPTDVLAVTISGEALSVETHSAEVRLAELSIEDWLETYRALGGVENARLSILRAILEACRQPQLLVALARRPELDRVGCGMCVLDGELLGIFDLIVDALHRRRGYGAALIRELLRWGLARGVRRAYLQVVRSNTAALALYRQLGFTAAYEYWYRIRPERA